MDLRSELVFVSVFQISSISMPVCFISAAGSVRCRLENLCFGSRAALAVSRADPLMLRLGDATNAFPAGAPFIHPSVFQKNVQPVP